VDAGRPVGVPVARLGLGHRGKASYRPPVWLHGRIAANGTADIVRALDRIRLPGRPRLEVLGDAGPVDMLGLVPGSFDPITVAHAALADALDAELTLFVYSPRTLPKEPGVEPPLLEKRDRVASLLAYCAARPRRGVALASHGRLVDQAEAAAVAFPGASLVFGVGSDKVAQVLDPRWYEDPQADLRRLFTLAEIRYGVRAEDTSRIEEVVRAAGPWRSRIRPLDLPGEVVSLSSRAVRAALRRGDEVDALVPAEVRPFLRSGGGSR
jgi:nicotinic acid mononucleotide adenylyltransferase